MVERCMVCKYTDKYTKESTYRSTFYISNSGKDIHLCRDHSRELFLEGQRRFIKNNLRILQRASLALQADSWFFTYMHRLGLD